jgi:hypothetical protein
VHRWGNGTNRLADAHIVEHVEAGWMNGVRREDLIAWQPVLIKEQDRRTGPSEERCERRACASRADYDDVIASL